jgi:peptidoglycan hydrolase-like protein with peptidoglycan-binding domain
VFRRLITGLTLGVLTVAAPLSTSVPLHHSAALAAPNSPALPRLGDRGDSVVGLQKALIAKGIRVPGGADGIFGQGTQAAVRVFQESVGLPPTGAVDAITGHLLGLAPAPALPATGQRGDAVRALQQALIDAGVTVRGGADGIFGNATTTAVRSFQNSKNLPATGVVDVMTAIALKVLPVSNASTNTGAPTEALSTSSTNASAFAAIGERSQRVTVLQKALIAAGVTVRGGADGIFGNATATAIRTYQESVGLAASGRLDEPTAQLLGLIAAPDLPRRGDSSDSVRAVQKKLIGLGFRVAGGADGVFGSATTQAISAFQRERGFEETGKLDLRTYVVLMSGSAQGSTSGSSSTAPVPEASDSGPAAKVEIFPVQGPCWFTDTWQAPRGGGRVHVGVDIIAPTGKAVYAVADGTITRVFFDRPGSLGGNAVRLTAADGTYFHYAHFSKFGEGIEVGTKVKLGQVIGYVGSTGNSSTPHLHFEYHPKGGAAVNPYPIVKAINGCKNTELWSPPTDSSSTPD